MMQAFRGTPSEWDALTARLPDPHLLQTWEWAQVKSQYGWQPMPFIWQDDTGIQAAAMVLKRSIPVGGFARKMCVLYVPKGPLLDWTVATLRTRVLDDLQALTRKQGAIFVKIDPDAWLGKGIPGSPDATEDSGGQALRSDLGRRGWVFSQDQIQFRNTVLIDLSASEDEILGRMKQKTRYNVRLAEKKGVTVRTGGLADLPLLYRMYAETSLRDDFAIRDEGYYRAVWQAFMQATDRSQQPFAEPLIAEVDGEAVAAIFVFAFAGRAYYLYGMSRQAHREKMPNHLLQWEAMKRARAAGCRVYDLWGAPDEFDESDSMWGVYRFKEGLGGTVYRGLGAWDFTPSPMLYKLYTNILPRVLDVMRFRGRARTKRMVG
jgi:lipid II:glycine glycyltransferase (peptidoglycan interpeptide bridge formation enzyme)